MDFATILSSISKLAIVAFVVTFAVIVYEIYLLSRKKDVREEVKPEVALPDFAEGNFKKIKSTTVVHNYAQEPLSKKQIVLLGILLVVFGITAVAGFIYVRNNYQTADEALRLPTRTNPIERVPVIEQTPMPSPTKAPEVVAQALDVDSEVTSPTPTVFLAASPTQASALSTGLSPTPTIYIVSNQSELTLTPTLFASPSSSMLSATLQPSISDLPKTGTFAPLSLMLVLVAVSFIGLGFIL